MDFDEYEYLEKTVENPEPSKAKETANGGEETVKSEEKERSRSSKHKRDEKDDDYVDDEDAHRTRRSKSGEDSRDHDRHKERGSSHHRSQSRDGGKDWHRSSRERKDRDREERNGQGRDKDRDRDRRDRDRDSDRGKDKERERDREREGERSRRSRSHSERHRSDPDEDRERSRDREYREREREREREKERERERELRERDRESRRHKEKKDEVAEAEADPERDQRTVFAYQINLKATERDVYEFFSRAGKVRDVRLIMDRNSRRSKGVGYIEFYDVMSVPMAIALSGQPLRGQPVMVKPSEAEKNLVQSTTSAAVGSGGVIGPYSGGARRLYVGNLHTNITEDQLRQVFEPFGSVELVQLPLDETGHCKGFGFVQFSRLEDARNALNLNGQVEIAGRPIKVSTVTDQTGMPDVGAKTGDLDDDEGGGLSLNAHSRALLMQKLDRSGVTSSSLGTSVLGSAGVALPAAPILGATPVIPLVQGSVPPLGGLPGVGLQLPTAGLSVPSSTVLTVDSIGAPSECLLLKNMFDPNAETEPDFDLDIKEDVQDECSKFGNVKHIYVDKNSAGFVYLRFDDVQAAMKAQHSLHGRWFAGKMITATFMVPQSYEAKFPESR